MRKLMVVVIILVMAMAFTANAQIINTATGLGSPSIKDNNQNQNTNLNTDVNTNTNVNTFVPVNTNIQGQQQGQVQGQQQGQLQGQVQGQNNFQNISPEQKVIFKSPTQLLALPSQSVPELNFGHGHMIDVTWKLPKFALGQIKPLGKDDVIIDVLTSSSKVSFANLYKKVFKSAVDSDVTKVSAEAVRYQIVCREGQRTWTTGGNIGGGGSGVSTGGFGGGSGGGSLVPQIGGTYAHDLYDVIFVRVVR